MDEEFLDVEPLFLAVTRPAMWAGIPIEAGVMILILGTSMLILAGNPIYAAALSGVLYAIARLVVRYDQNAFRLLFLFCRTKLANRNRSFWGGSSYTPLPLLGLKRKGFGRRG